MKERISLYVSKELKERISEKCERTGLTMNALTIIALLEYLGE